jgi:DNA-binding Lrp family transcriptional regulator
MPESVTLDRFDTALLQAVRQNNQTPARILAERVGLSESAVLRRLRRLRREGVIAADVAVVRPDLLGRPLCIHVLVSLEREGAAELEAFVQALRGRPEVRDAWYVTGEADFLLRLQLADMAEYDAFTRAVFHGEPNVRAFRSVIAMRQVVGPAPPGS